MITAGMIQIKTRGQDTNAAKLENENDTTPHAAGGIRMHASIFRTDVRNFT